MRKGGSKMKTLFITGSARKIVPTISVKTKLSFKIVRQKPKKYFLPKKVELTNH